MTRRNRLLSLLLAAAMVLALVPAAVFAAGAANGSAILTGFRTGSQAGGAGIVNNDAGALKITANSKNSTAIRQSWALFAPTASRTMIFLKNIAMATTKRPRLLSKRPAGA